MQGEDSSKLLHLLDQFSRYGAGEAVKDYKQVTVIGVLMKAWVKIFFPPKAMFSDNGSGKSEEVVLFLEHLGAEIRQGPAFSQNCYGMVERQNRRLSEL